MPKIGKLVELAVKDLESEIAVLVKTQPKPTSIRRRKRRWGSKKNLNKPAENLKRSASKKWRITRLKVLFAGNKVVSTPNAANLALSLDAVEPHDPQTHPLEDMPAVPPTLSNSEQQKKDRDESWQRQQELQAKSERIMSDIGSGLEAAEAKIGLATKSNEDAHHRLRRIEDPLSTTAQKDGPAESFSTHAEDAQKLDELLKSFEAKGKGGDAYEDVGDPKTWGISTAAPVCDDEKEAGLVRRQVQENQRVYKNEERKRKLEDSKAQDLTFKPKTNLPPLKRRGSASSEATKEATKT
jgi:hypothetical protein